MVLSTGMEKSRNTVGCTLGDEAVYLRLALFLIVANLQDNIDWNSEDGVRSWKKKETGFNTSGSKNRECSNNLGHNSLVIIKGRYWGDCGPVQKQLDMFSVMLCPTFCTVRVMVVSM